MKIKNICVLLVAVLFTMSIASAGEGLREVKLDNGNLLTLVWEKVTSDEAVSQGRDPEHVAENGEFWYEGVLEVNPYTLDVVWEWSVRHHLIQDFDPGKSNYGVVADHPERLNINVFRQLDLKGWSVHIYHP